MKEPKLILIYGLALIKFAFPFALQNSTFTPHTNEFLFLEQGNHLDWGYLESPPLLSALAWITNLLGNDLFWIKLWPSLFGTLTFVLVGRIVLLVEGGTFAIFLSFLPFIFGAYLRMHYLFQPIFLDVFFSTFIIYALINFIHSQKNYWLYLLGIGCGLGMMSKYSVAFTIVSVLIGLLVSPQRKVFLNIHFYISLLIGAIIFSPNVWWQYNHGFPALHFVENMQEATAQYAGTSDFILDQLVMNLPCVFIWIMGLLMILLLRKRRIFIFLFFGYFILMILLLTLNFKGYYALSIYPALFAFGAKQFERLTIKRVQFTRYIMITIPFYFGYLSMPLAMPIFNPQQLDDLYQLRQVEVLGVLKWDDGRNHSLPQDFAEMLGWKQIAEHTLRVYKNLGSDAQSKTIIYCSNSGLAGALTYYGKQMGLPPVISESGSFVYWMPEKYDVQNIILLSHSVPGKDDEIFREFANITEEDQFHDPYAKEDGVKIILCQAPFAQLNQVLEQRIARKKMDLIRKN